MAKVTRSTPAPRSSARRSSFVGSMLSMRDPLDSADDSQMGSAATEIVSEGLLDLIDGGMRLLPQQRCHLHDHAIDAIAALHGLFVDEGLLQRMRALGRAETFEGDDLARSDGG